MGEEATQPTHAPDAAIAATNPATWTRTGSGNTTTRGSGAAVGRVTGPLTAAKRTC